MLTTEGEGTLHLIRVIVGHAHALDAALWDHQGEQSHHDQKAQKDDRRYGDLLSQAYDADLLDELM
jgi:hypothetical protein